MERSPSWEANSHSASQEIPFLLEPEGLLRRSKQPALGPSPEPDESSPHISN